MYILRAIVLISSIFLVCGNSTSSTMKASTSSTTATFYPLSEVNEFIYPIPSDRYKSYHLILSQGYCQPDNYRQSCYLINDQFPGPLIVVNSYDFLEVTVVNYLPTPTTIHFHGILQTRTLDADGVPFVTQDPIQPNQTYVYKMQIEGQTGTYMYHGHFELDLVWLHGPLIVRDNPAYWQALGPPYNFDPGHEHVFELEAVYHQPLEELVNDILQNGNDDPPIASLAINGLSYGRWPSNNGNAPGYEVVEVEARKTYRFRIINISAGSYFRFEIENHTLTVIETDGIIVDPVNISHLEINTGQRYSVLVTMNSNPANYWISCELMAGADEGGPANGKAILHYTKATNPALLRKQLFLGETPAREPTFLPFFKDLHPNRNYTDNQALPFPEKSNHSIFIDMHFVTKDGPPKFLINGHQFIQPNSSYLSRVRQGQNISEGDPHVFEIHQGDIVDMIFQNRVDDTGGCDEHPIHLHGHQFWVMLSGQNAVDMESLPGQLEEVSKTGEDQVFRDVFTLFPNQSPENSTGGAKCGYAVIRFVANNPGLWLVHCHITSHMMLGKMFTLYEINPINPMLINE